MTNLLEELKALGGGKVNPMVFLAIESQVLNKYSFQVSLEQTKIILESVPDIFPEDMGIKSYDRIRYCQKRAYRKIAGAGDKPPRLVPIIVEVIKTGVDIRDGIKENSRVQENPVCIRV